MTKKTIEYKEILRRQAELKRVQSLGVELVFKKNMFKVVVGGVLAVVGAVTLPLPTGSAVLIPMGLSLMVSGGVDVWGYKKKLISRLRWWRLMI